MASLQSRTVNGKKYWYIVESKRVNGKPRPIIVGYLGSADNLLLRIASPTPQSIKTYSHGLVFTLYMQAEKLNIANIINTYNDPVSNRPLHDPIMDSLCMLVAHKAILKIHNNLLIIKAPLQSFHDLKSRMESSRTDFLSQKLTI